MQAVATFAKLLLGTVIYRPYVYAFFVCFLYFALHHLRGRGTLAYAVLAYFLAFAAEYSATRNGFPFGSYVYIDSTRTRELWISNIPFWDSLSFIFLSYFSWLVASAVRSPGAPERSALQPQTAVLAGLLMMLLDVVIDPLTLLGDRWFLGRIYYYPDGGSYFGVTLSNFVGWFVVGAGTLLVFQTLVRFGAVDTRRWGVLSSRQVALAFGVYAGIFFFQLTILLWLREWQLLAASGLVVAGTLGTCLAFLRARSSPRLAAVDP